MIDLITFVKQTEEIKFLDGDIINLKKPTQGLLLELMGISEKLEENKEPEKLIKTLNNIVVDILNNNIENRTFTTKEIETIFDFGMIKGLIKAYMKWANELTEQDF